MMTRALLGFMTILGIASTRQAAAQDSFGEILLQAFTTGVAPSSDVGPQPIIPSPMATPIELLSEESLISSPDPDNSLEYETSSPEITAEEQSDLQGFESLSASVEALIDDEETDILPSLTPDPEATPEETPEETLEFEESPSPTAFVTIEDNTVFTPISVNCGSFDERSTFNEGSDKWYNADSLTAEDPFALTRFSSLAEGVLFATYRYAEDILTYTVPLTTSGIFEITLRWAEISPFSMREGERVFKVLVNDEEVESHVDIFADSPLGSYSPISRIYLVEARQKVITIKLIKIVGQPMLSAFQVQRLEPAPEEIDL